MEITFTDDHREYVGRETLIQNSVGSRGGDSVNCYDPPGPPFFRKKGFMLRVFLAIVLALLSACASTELQYDAGFESFCVFHTWYAADVQDCVDKEKGTDNVELIYETERDRCYTRLVSDEASIYDMVKELAEREAAMRTEYKCPKASHG